MRAWPLLAAALLVGGCTGGGEPNRDEIRAALGQAGNRGGPKAEKLACKRSPERPGFVCDYRAPACNRYTGTCGATRPATGRFLHASGRWQLVEDLTPRATPDPVTQPLPGVVVAPSGAVSNPAATAEPAPAPTASPQPTPPPRQMPRPAPEPDFDAPSADDDDGGRPSIEELGQVSRWIGLNTRCRFGRGDGGDIAAACVERDRLTQRLEDRGLCYGRRSGWQRCD